MQFWGQCYDTDIEPPFPSRADVAAMSDAELLAIRNVGRKGLAALRQFQDNETQERTTR